MAILNITDQKAGRDNMLPYFNNFKIQLDKRLDIWQRISDEKKKKWITSDKDPVMSLAWAIYKYLDGFFGDVKND